jgi:hypothetical protein
MLSMYSEKEVLDVVEAREGDRIVTVLVRL